ncbi:MAG TPA: amidohydrolase family protein [Pyrinomonadaceae bacterium]|nr:amidohydrolase family protein [Chloracidobacterium sp.]MBP9936073.1 amidohydrolase family protein [Pyrinomonadaceae bacterium]MBK7802182.1 amidohydrolase family protein [Chloracidobacterium sp.]MBK9437670.1 amidohydrolase family protein [Chloracidobacterium sp.]MBL0239729.1 amidohydrolase family protein [Chloracidobacterium sp.]
MKIERIRNLLSSVLVAAIVVSTAIGQALPSSFSGKRVKRIVVRNAMVVDGSGKPAAGPLDIYVENDVIKRIVGSPATRPSASNADELVIDATGKYVLPGLINLHGHTQDERAGVPMPVEYVTKMWLACGITTVRDAWADPKILGYRDQINAGTLVGPRLFPYGGFPAADLDTAVQVRQRVRDLKAAGYDGIKLYTMDRDLMAAMLDEAKKQGMRVMHHAGVEESNAWDDIKGGTTSIEHWYGIPDAAIESGRQDFPSTYNYNNEVDRFRYAGRLWREADPEKLSKVLDAMVAANVAWDPTLVIYEASRDLQRAQTNPAFAEYLHPVLADYFRPNPANHGSYFIGWSTTDETFWKENYRIWMKAVYDFEKKGGLIGTGEDAGFIYQMYGFGLIRELELHQEAGFSPLKVIQHATSNGAKILGKEDSLGRIRVGYKADLIVVNGNPLENFKVLYPNGTDEVRDGKVVRGGGIEWTIRDGVPFHVPTLSKEIREMVLNARKGQNREQ